MNNKFYYLLEKARNLKNKKDYKNAIKTYRELEKNFPDLVTDTINREIFDTAYNAGFRAYNSFYNPMDAILNLEYAASKIDKCAIPYITISKLFRNYSLSLMAINKFEEALTKNLEAEKYIKKEMDKIYYYKILRDRGKIFILLSKYTSGIKLYKKVYNFFKNNNDGEFLNTLRELLDHFLLTKCNLETSERFLNEAMKYENTNKKWFTNYFFYFYGYNGIFLYLKNNKYDSFNFLMKYYKKNPFRYYKLTVKVLIILSKITKDKKYLKEAIEILEEKRQQLRDLKLNALFLHNNFKYYIEIFQHIIKIDKKYAYSLVILIKSFFEILEIRDKKFKISFDKYLKLDHLRLNYKFQYYEPIKFSLTEIQKLLKENDIVLDYYYDHKKLYIFHLTNNYFKLKILTINIKLFEKNIISIIKLKNKILKKSIGFIISEKYKKELLKKYIFFSKILLPQIFSNKRIYIIPYKNLNRFSFQNLLMRNNKFINIENEIIFLSNIATLKYRQNYIDKVKNIGIICDKNLEFGKKESSLIEKYYKTIYLKSIKNIKNCDIIHFCTHYYADKNIEKSYFSFNNKKITVKEIKKYNYKNKKIILNVCESGNKKRIITEEYLDLSRLFLVRDASEVLVTTMKIKDYIAYKFFTEFYRISVMSNNFNTSDILRKTLKNLGDFILINPYIIRK